MKIAERMTKTVWYCHPNESLESATQLLWDHDCGALPVVDDDGRVCGMITDRDVCMAAYTTGRRLAEIRVRDVMANSVAAAPPTATIQDVEATMRRHRVHRLPVLNATKHLLGMITCNDLLRWVDDGGNHGQPHPDAAHLIRTLTIVTTPRTLQTGTEALAASAAPLHQPDAKVHAKSGSAAQSRGGAQPPATPAQ